MAFPVKAYIIHVPGDVRRERNVDLLTASLRQAGVAEVIVHEGVRPQDRGPLYSVGEWGCYQSHVACMRRIAGDPEGGPALVLEDDAVLDVDAQQLGRSLDGRCDWDFFHLGYLSNTVFREWDEHLLRQDVLRVRGVLYGMQCYAVRPARLATVVEALDRLPYTAPEQGGGVGIDGALCEVAWGDPSLVRLASTTSMFRTLPGIRSGLRRTSPLQRGLETARALARPVRRLTSASA